MEVLRDLISLASKQMSFCADSRANDVTLHTITLRTSLTFSVLHSAVAKNRPDPVSLNPTTPQNPSEAAN